MTIAEAKYTYGTRRIVSNYGDTIQSVARRIYKSNNTVYINVLKALNNRYDWFNIKPGSSIEYFPENVVSVLSGVW